MSNPTKQELRRFYKQKRQELFEHGLIDKISDAICAKILKSAIFKNAKNIMLFYPKGSELNPLGLLNTQDKDKKFFLPRCKEDSILVCPYKSGDKLVLNTFNIKEPVSTPITDIKILDIVIVPALCADINGNRLGYGKGFYDRFFSNPELKAKKIAILPDEMLIKKLPADDYDVRCNIIATERQLLELT